MQLKEPANASLFIFEAMFLKWNRFQEVLFNWELWPFALRYLFISPVWLWYCIRSGSLWYFTPSNPTLTFGGFEGEGKREMYALLPNRFYPKTIFINPAEPFEQVKQRVAAAGFTYPFCVKPDVGMAGLLFRKIDSEQALATYHQKMPVDYMVQAFIDYPLEVSVFYYRYPNEEKGVISGFIQKEAMEVVGDGQHTLLQLIQAHPKAKHREEEMRLKHAAHLEHVLPHHTTFPLAHAANLSRGGQFKKLEHLIDDDLLRIFDTLSHRAQFYYGRYDIKCQSIAELKQEKNFSILEFNGSGAEPNHVIGTGYTLFQAQRVFLHHWKVLYEISKYNDAHGVKYWSFLRGWEFTLQAKKHLRLLERYDTKILV
jgi:hypothetical protein